MFKPVTFEEDERGGFRTVTTAKAALRAMTDWWGVRVGDDYFAATVALQAALDGTGTEEAAREAFVVALREAGVFVRE